MLLNVSARRLFSAAFLTTAALPLTAQENPSTILVLDASGSMWGQIDGVTKIEIARNVIGDLLLEIPQDTAIGLTTYGHRRKGDCSDIETIIPPATGQIHGIADAILEINPRGKTPMTDAVIAAAEALRYTEERATVILVSDGIETCNPDPCAAARTLEETGVDFTAHVVGFDVSDNPEAISQMQCLAQETGGSFTTASDAAELADALSEVAAAPPHEPEPAVAPVTFRAVLDGEAGPLVEGRVEWEITDADGIVMTGVTGNPLEAELAEGSYVAHADWLPEEVSAEVQFIALSTAREIAVVFDTPAPKAVITAPETAVAGSTIEVSWQGPGNARDRIAVTPLNADPGYVYRAVNETNVEGGNPLNLLMPPQPGDYLIEYILDSDNSRVVSVPLTVTPVTARILAPASAEAGSTIEIAWEGPDYLRDWIGVTPPDAESDYPYRAVNSVQTSEGSPLQLMMPTEPGQYLIEYSMDQASTRVTSVPIEITDIAASVTAPASAEAGSTIEVAWSGPDYPRDRIGVTPVDGDPAWPYRAVNETRTEDGNPLKLLMPAQPGNYLIEYIVDQDHSRLVSVPIEVTEVAASITAPPSAVAGSTIEIAWSGPSYDRDMINVTPVDADPTWPYRAVTEAKVSDGSPLRLRMPAQPGQYLVEYHVAQDHSRLASVPIEITPVTATLTAPATAPMGATIEIGWTGPDYARDTIDVTPVDADPSAPYRAATEADTEDGNPARLLMPSAPGQYLIEYHLAQDHSRLTSVPIEITPVTARIIAPSQASPGSEIEVNWEGPNYARDMIGISPVDADPTAVHRFERKENITGPGPMRLKMPEEPGTYVIEYSMGLDRVRLTSVPITIR